MILNAPAQGFVRFPRSPSVACLLPALLVALLAGSVATTDAPK